MRTWRNGEILSYMRSSTNTLPLSRYKHLPDLAAQVKVMPLKIWPGGLDAIPEALAYLRAGKTSAEKIAVPL